MICRLLRVSFILRYEFLAQIRAELGESAVDANDVFRCLERGITLVNEAISCLLHLRLITHVVESGFNDGGPVFLALCMLPLIGYFSLGELWTKGTIAHILRLI